MTRTRATRRGQSELMSLHPMKVLFSPVFNIRDYHWQREGSGRIGTIIAYRQRRDIGARLRFRGSVLYEIREKEM